MIKQGIKNYFKSLKYFFTPLGTMFLGMMLGFSILRRQYRSRRQFNVQPTLGFCQSVGMGKPVGSDKNNVYFPMAE